MQQRGEETRRKILAAANRCIAREGYNATGVAEICIEAGVSKGAFYHHFATKQAVFLTLLEEWLAGIDASLQSVRGEGKTVAAALMEMAGKAQSVFEAADNRLPMFLEFWTQASRDPQVWQATIQPYYRYRQFFAALIREGIAEGSLRPVDPEAAATTVVSMAVGLFLQAVLDPAGGPWGKSAESGIRLLMSGLAEVKA